MKNVLRFLRLCRLIILIVLACFGMGISGGVPIPTINKKEETIEISIETDESSEDDETVVSPFEKL